MPASESTFALVATTLYVLLVDLHTKNVLPLENRRPEYYGISWLPDAEDLILSHSALDNSSLVDLATYAHSEVGYLSRGESVTPNFLSAPHQILCGSDGRVICTNTGRNAISVIDLDRPSYIQEAKSSPARWDRLSLECDPGDHLNSLFEKDGLLYVIAHGHRRGSSLITLSYPDLRIVEREPIKGRTGLHNIWVTDAGQKISCHSEAGALIEISSGEVLWDSGSQIYTRGLAASSEFVLIGESQKLGRDLRSGSISGLWLVDPKTWQTLDYFCLGPYGAVHEVRLLNVLDLAHHGHPFAGLNKLLTRNLRSTMAEEKMRMSFLARRDRDAWKDFIAVMGTPVPREDGARAADQGICLFVQQIDEQAVAPQPVREFAFKYALNWSEEDSHVSVVSYRGGSGDSDMHALLIKAVSPTQACLNLWVHDGQSWTVRPGIVADNLPIEADVKVRATPDQLELHVNSHLILEIPAESVRLNEGSLGIRWLGATIYPPNKTITDA